MVENIFFKDQREFSNWLELNSNRKEIWLGYFKKSSGRAGLTWSESVDVALCFGWIDGLRKTIDFESYKIRFTPRKLSSSWSAVNVKKARELIKQGKMKPEGLELFNKRVDTEGYSSAGRNVDLDPVYEKKIRANNKAWVFFVSLAPSYKRDSIWWIMSAKKEETRMRRLNILIESSEQELKIPSLRKP